jgi:SAM-dependent methyltransferase
MAGREVEEQQRALWSRAAEAWRRWAPQQDASTRPVSERMLERALLRPGQRILDVACGRGALALEAARRVLPAGAVVATDLSPEMLEGARLAARNGGAGNLELVVAAAEAPPPGPYDAVTCRFGLMFFPDPGEAVRAWGRVARPGARVVVAVWSGPEDNPFMTIRARLAREVLGGELPTAGPWQQALAEPGGLERTLAGAGLTGVTVEKAPLRWCGDDARTLAEMLCALSPQLTVALEAAGPARAAAFRAELARAFSDYADRGGAVAVPACSLIGFGEA